MVWACRFSGCGQNDIGPLTPAPSTSLWRVSPLPSPRKTPPRGPFSHSRKRKAPLHLNRWCSCKWPVKGTLFNPLLYLQLLIPPTVVQLYWFKQSALKHSHVSQLASPWAGLPDPHHPPLHSLSHSHGCLHHGFLSHRTLVGCWLWRPRQHIPTRHI